MNLFFVGSRTEINHAVAELIQAIPASTDEQVIAGMAPSLTQRATGFRALPIRLYWYRDGLHVRSATTRYRVRSELES